MPEKLRTIQKKIFSEITQSLQIDFRSGFKNTKPFTVSESIQKILTNRSQKAFRIYQSHSKTALVESLRITYSVCDQLVGAEFFKLLALEYLQNNRPTRANLDYYGENFGHYLKPSDLIRKHHLNYLPDIARLEWAWKTCLQVASPQKITPAAWQGLSEQALEQIKFKLNQNIKIISSDYPVDHIFLDNYHCAPDQVKTRDLKQSDNQKISILVWGTTEQVYLKRLNRPEIKLLESLQNKLSVSQISLVFDKFKDIQDNSYNLFNTIAQWIQLGVIIDFNV